MFQLISLLALFFLFSPASGAWYSSSTALTSHDGFSFAGRFCFANESPDEYDLQEPVGLIDLTITLHPDAPQLPAPSNTSSPNPMANFMSAAIYFDSSDSWPAVRDRPTLLCEQKLEKAELYQQIVFSQEQPQTFTARLPVIQQTRPRFWFLVFTSCSNPEYLKYLEWEAHFYQAKKDAWNQEFGENEAGLNTLYLIFFLLYLALTSCHFKGFYTLYRSLNYLHPLVKLFSLALSIESLAITFEFIHTARYSQDGRGFLALYRTGIIFDLFSRLIFVFLLLLLAGGWTVATSAATNNNANDPGAQYRKYWILGFLNTFFLLYALLLFWQWVETDPQYTSVPATQQAFNLLAFSVWLLMSIYFLYTITSTYRREIRDSKRSFFLKFGFFFTIWLFAFPSINLLVYLVDDWARAKAVEGLSVTLTFVAYLTMAILLWPSRALEYFRIEMPQEERDQITHEHYEQL